MVAVLAGTHAEGGIWATLFGLLMWDILFMDVPDVFQTPFQTAPLDLGTVVFYPTRQEAIEKRLSQIQDGQAVALLQHCWQQHLGEWCRGINWERHSKILCIVRKRGLSVVSLVGRKVAMMFVPKYVNAIPTII